MKSISYSLSPDEISTLKIMASWRANKKTNMASANLWSKGKDRNMKNLEGHYLGVVGEFIVAKGLNGFFDPMPRIAGDKHSADIVSGVGDNIIRVSVKTTKYDPPIFKLNHLDEIHDSTHCALCLYKEPVITVYWIKSKAEFLKDMYVDDFGYGKRFCLGI